VLTIGTQFALSESFGAPADAVCQKAALIGLRCVSLLAAAGVAAGRAAAEVPGIAVTAAGAGAVRLLVLAARAGAGLVVGVALPQGVLMRLGMRMALSVIKV